MSIDPSTLLYGLYVSVFLTTLLLAHGFWLLHAAWRGRGAALRRRLRGAAEPEPAVRAPAGLRRARPVLPGRLDALATPLRRVAGLLDQAGLPGSLRGFALVVAGLTVVAGMAAAGLSILFGLTPARAGPIAVLAVPTGLALGLGLPIAYLRHRRARRLARFAAQLPDALEVMVRSLRAGHPVASALAMVEADLPEPIAGAFAGVVDEMTYGLDLRQALGHLAARVEVEDLRFVVASVSLQHETGGNLAEVLQRQADLMRARFRLTRKVRAFTAEARLSAQVLAVMPFVFVGLVMAANPAIYSDAARDPLFLPVLLAAGALQAAGILVMRRMARLRV